MPNKIILLADTKILAADRKKKNKIYEEEMTCEEQIQSNPEIDKNDITNGVGYIKKDKKSKEGKENKEDKANQNFLKKQGLYDQKTSEHDMYEKGTGDAQEIDINDVIQGALGDCYLISAIAAVAKENPSYIKKIIEYKDKETYATVTLYIRNEKGVREAKKIIVDFYFPVSGVVEAYAKKGDSELWVMVIEKAYAKEMGGYHNIGKGGDSGEALAVLTGREPIIKKIADSEADLEKDLDDATIAGKCAVTGTKPKDEIPTTYTITEVTPGKADGWKVGLSSNNHVFCSHAYTIIEVDKTTKKVKLRNPHGGTNAEILISFKEFKDCFSSFKVINIPQ